MLTAFNCGLSYYLASIKQSLLQSPGSVGVGGLGGEPCVDLTMGRIPQFTRSSVLK